MKKKKEEEEEGRKRVWSHGHKVIVKVCCLGIAHRHRKTFSSEHLCPCEQHHFWSFDSIGSGVEPVDAEQTSG